MARSARRTRDVWRFFVRQDVCSRCEDGKILWHFATKGSVIDGPSIVNGILKWGSGYGRVGGTPNNILYTFTVLQSSE